MIEYVRIPCRISTSSYLKIRCWNSTQMLKF